MGLDNAELAKRLNVSLTTITNDLSAMGLTRPQTHRTNGKTVTNPVKALDRVVGQLADLTEQLDDIIIQVRAYDYLPEPELLERWEKVVSRRNNPSAAITRLRRYINHQKELLTQ
jgi:hypothetical protein